MSKQKKEGFIKQHIVPQSYLNGFASVEKKKSQHKIGVLHKSGKCFCASTKDVGFIKNYYDDKKLPDIKHWEHYYCNEIEASCIKTIRKLIAKVTLSNFGHVSITESEKYNLSRFIIAQFTRVPQFIDHQITIAKSDLIPSFKRKILRRYGRFLSNEKREVVNGFGFTDDELKNIVLTNINDRTKNDSYCRDLTKKIWILYINKVYRCFPFITSDNPIVMYNVLKKSFSRSDNGIGNDNSIIYVPLCPYLAIGIYPEGYRFSLNANDCKEVILDENDFGFIFKMANCEIEQCYQHAFIPLFFYKEIVEEGKK